MGGASRSPLPRFCRSLGRTARRYRATLRNIHITKLNYKQVRAPGRGFPGCLVPFFEEAPPIWPKQKHKTDCPSLVTRSIQSVQQGGRGQENGKDSDGRRGDPRSRQAWICETKALQYPVDGWRFVSGYIRSFGGTLRPSTAGHLSPEKARRYRESSIMVLRGQRCIANTRREESRYIRSTTHSFVFAGTALFLRDCSPARSVASCRHRNEVGPKARN